MALNPFFLQGSSNEQFLVQDLINEQLKIYGVDVYYLPRKIFKTDNIIREIQSSKFDDVFMMEAYINNYDGYAPDSDIMTKFGLRLKNEISLTISKERYEEFIAPFLEGISSGIREGRITEYDFADLITRPKEGDLIYFPLGERLFEIKRVESEKPFYQLGKNYTYELSCELYEYENELIDTNIEQVDNTVEDEGYITSLVLVGTAITATATAGISSGSVNQIFIDDDGSGYTTTPTVTFSDPPNIAGGDVKATAVAITTNKGNIQSIQRLELTNGGSGYTKPPIITITGGGGSGAAVTCSISTTEFSVNTLSLTNGGRGYGSAPIVTIDSPIGPGAAATVTVSAAGTVTAATIDNGGAYYNPNTPPEVTFSTPSDRINGVTLLNPSSVLPRGSNFTSGVYTTNNVSLGATGTGLTLDVTVNGSGAVTAAEIADPGQHYANGNVVTITNGLGGASGTVSFAVVTAENIDGVTATGISSVSSAGIVTSISITNAGVGYYSGATVSIANTAGNKVFGSGLSTATAISKINNVGAISQLTIIQGGIGYTSTPTIQFTGFATVGVGTFVYNEEVTGQTSGTTGRVRDFRVSIPASGSSLETTNLRVSLNTGKFIAGEIIVGSISSAKYVVQSYDTDSYDNPYDVNEEIELEADNILDFTESNPFGTF